MQLLKNVDRQGAVVQKRDTFICVYCNIIFRISIIIPLESIT
jgi:hypothetical protein